MVADREYAFASSKTKGDRETRAERYEKLHSASGILTSYNASAER